VSQAELIAQIERRATRAGVTAQAIAPSLAQYLEILARWNRRINLTAYALEPPADDAIDRLIVEPLVAARHVLPQDRRAIDVGSGGGSPGLPLSLASPGLRLLLVESKARKAAFLREAVRHLALQTVDVENRRLEELVGTLDIAAADLATLRAVRAEDSLWVALKSLLRPGGRVFWFTTGATPPPAAGWETERVVDLIPEAGSQLAILRATR
jgi:16S rRNA (guanine527-N7)-methyltransferase